MHPRKPKTGGFNPDTALALYNDAEAKAKDKQNPPTENDINTELDLLLKSVIFSNFDLSKQDEYSSVQNSVQGLTEVDNLSLDNDVKKISTVKNYIANNLSRWRDEQARFKEEQQKREEIKKLYNEVLDSYAHYISYDDTSPKKQSLLNAIISRLSVGDKVMEEVVLEKNYPQLITMLTELYQANYNVMLNTALELKNSLLKQYAKAKEDFDADSYKYPSMAMIPEVDDIKESIEKGLTINDKFPPKMHLLIHQINGLTRELTALTKPEEVKKEWIYNRNRILEAHQSLTKVRTDDNGKQYTDLKIIQKDLHPIKRFFKNVVSVVADALSLGSFYAANTLIRLKKGKEAKNSQRFFKPKGYDTKRVLRYVEKTLGIKKTPS